MKKRLLLLLCALPFLSPAQDKTAPPATPQYRLGYHFAPAAHWMNDPNGMVFDRGVYHLFFQYYPDGMSWGPMHWGHATSPDMLSWQEQPIALYPDKLGYIFSGSAVLDVNNTAGFGKNAMVAIFTHHDPEQAGKNTGLPEYQSLAYSLDGGKTWQKYDKNPVLKNPGIADFRDPKVSWNDAAKEWVMTLATKDRLTFYSSPNLKDWARESEFGEKLGAHGGVWECPDLFPLQLNGKTYWVLIVNINPGGPNGGSATQYFVGQFDGHKFTALNGKTKWADYGPDEYAGVTWANTGTRRLFLGWMSNWEYAEKVPTSPWRSANTLPRELGLKQVGEEIYLTSQPAREVARLATSPRKLTGLTVKPVLDLTDKLGLKDNKFMLRMKTLQLNDFTLVLGNSAGEELRLGYDKTVNQYFIDRSKSGQTSFSGKFIGRAAVPRRAITPAADVTLYFDATSVEIFADGGLSVATALFFPGKPFTTVKLLAPDGLTVNELTVSKLNNTMPAAAKP